MNPLKYGDIPYMVTKTHFVVPVGEKTLAVIQVKDNGTENHVDLKMKGGYTLLSYIDKGINDDKFERVIGNNKYTFVKEGDSYK
jgi:hypothetical protein